MREIIQLTLVYQLTHSYLIMITVNYEENKVLSSLIKSYSILKVNYEDKIRYHLEIPIQDLPLFHNYDVQIIRQQYKTK